MKISVLISTYGGEEWPALARSRALPSAEGQMAHEVLLHHEPEATIAQTRNAAAALASGEWLLFLDADDELGSGFVQAMTRAYEQRGGGNGPPPLLTPAVSYVRKGRVRPAIFLDRGVSLQDDNWLVVGTLVHRDLFHEVGGFGEYPHGWEDWSLWAKCWKAGSEIVKVREAIYVAHWNPNSKHHIGWRDRQWQVATHHKVRRELFPELYEGASL